MNNMKRVAVYCGSSKGFDKIYSAEVAKLAAYLVKNDITVIYGAGNVGLMGILANEIIRLQGQVIGVIPEFLVQKEVSHNNLTSLEIVSSMHERKARMIELADGFIAMPGGFGTLDEIFEVLTWEQLALHNDPIGFYNINGYYNYLFEFLKNTVNQGFIKDHYLKNIVLEEDAQKLLSNMINLEKNCQESGKWVTK